MSTRLIPRLLAVVLGALVILSAVNAIAAGNTIPQSYLDEQNTVLTVNTKKPAACTMTLTAIVYCTGGNCDGANGNVNELIIGTTGNDIIRGRGGRDCILGGDGNDDIQGNNGGDVCFGGLGNDTFSKCETIIDP